MRMWRIGVGVVTLVGIGCGGGSSSSVPLDQFAQRSASVICKQNFACCDAGELAGKTLGDCVNGNEFAAGLMSGSIGDSQSKGRLSYSATQMGTCLDEIARLSCADWKSGKDPADRPSCAAAITANVAVGAGCQLSVECTSGNCMGATLDDNGNPVDGTCMDAMAKVAVGGACTGSSDACETGAYCDPASLTCLAKKAAGETCATSDECLNTCDSTTSTCTCYVEIGCSVAPTGPARRPVLVLVLVLVAALVAVRARDRPSRG